MRISLTYVELFAGAGGLSLGLDDAGWRPVAHAEIDRHARAVLRDKWPFVRLDGDVQAIDGREYSGVSLVSGGSPCQDLSVGGKREGLEGERSSLFYEQVRIWKESNAPFLLWENVRGSLTSNGGNDFAAVLREIVGADVDVPASGWGTGGMVRGHTVVAAYRVLDLQAFGIPQRRQRVFILASGNRFVDPSKVLAVTETNGERATPSRGQAGPFWDGSGIVPTLDISGIVKQQTMPEKSRLWAVRGEHWVPVVFSDMVDEDTDECPQCGAEYPICPCPGPTQEFAYRETADGLEALVPWLRRLTPVECERLMSWPDGWTSTGRDENGVVYQLPDTARFKLCGNGVASVCAAWIGERLADAIENCPFT